MGGDRAHALDAPLTHTRMSATVAFRAMLPSVLTAVQRIANASDPLKLHYSAIAYKPFLSLFNMTGLVESGQLPSALGEFDVIWGHYRATLTPSCSELRCCRRSRDPSAR